MLARIRQHITTHIQSLYKIWGRHGRDHGCMVVGFTTTCAISAYHH